MRAFLRMCGFASAQQAVFRPLNWRSFLARAARAQYCFTKWKRLAASFCYLSNNIHRTYVRYEEWKLTLCQETSYSDACLLHPPKGWINPLPVSGFFLPIFLKLKKTRSKPENQFLGKEKTIHATAIRIEWKSAKFLFSAGLHLF